MAPKEKQPATKATEGTPEGERIAKVLSRRGVASRREAERLIEDGQVTVNGKVITSPALNVTSRDRITISGHPLPDEEPARLWLYYKPEGLVTSASDEKGRDTVFDHLPEDMPRVMSVGRLDLNSEGLLLLTNDGELKRRLELPSTGWLRKYRVRCNGRPTDDQLEPLRKGITVDGEKFQPMQVTLDRVQGANAWLTIGLREGKNREIRRALNAIDLYVNRLIRTSYGPFRLNDLQPGQIEEIRPRVLRDQLGEAPEAADPDAKRPALKRAPRKTVTAPRHATEIEGPARRPAKTGAKPSAATRSRTADSDSRKPSGAAAKPAARTFSTTRKSAPRADADEKITLPRNARPGDGVKALSRAWKEAMTPDAGSKPARPARGAANRTTDKPAGKPYAKTAGKPAARPDSRPDSRPDARPAAKPGTRSAPKPAPRGDGGGKAPPRPRRGS
jgi:23S rRNA pseudouridine2605 synthase